MNLMNCPKCKKLIKDYECNNCRIALTFFGFCKFTKKEWEELEEEKRGLR
jgi:hypothetical protein